MEIRPLEYRNVVRNRYLISEEGNVYSIPTNPSKPLYELTYHYNYGYALVKLKVEDGRFLDFRVHRLVLATFLYDSDMDVDHKDANKTHNHYTNLEYVPEGENQRRAAERGLYPRGENHHKSVLTEKQVRAICELYEKGYNVREVQRILGLGDIHNIDKIMVHILYRDNWKSVTKDYSWDIDFVRLKVYQKEHLLDIARLIKSGKYTSKEIAVKYPQYNTEKLIKVIKKMRTKKLYKSILKEVECSTTIDPFVRDGNGFIILIPSKKGSLGASAPKEQGR